MNPSGGLECKGHPVGATGLAQIAEIVWQLRGEAGERQVKGARVALTQNGGGAIPPEEAALSLHILAVWGKEEAALSIHVLAVWGKEEAEDGFHL